MKPIMNINEIMLNIQLSQRMMMGICLGIAMLVIATLGFSIWHWVDDWTLTRQNTAALPIIAKVDQANEVISGIPGYHIFGKPINQMPITNLQMSVTGIVKVATQSGLTSKAYLSIDGAPGKIYKLGDVLPNGVKIYSISDDAVILENDGEFEKLPLPREKLKFKSKPGSFA